MQPRSDVPFAAGRRKLFSLHSRSGNTFLVGRIVGRARARARCYLHARYLSAGNRGRNFVSMGIVWQQVGKISTHRLPTAVPVPGFPTSVLYGNTISFSPAIFLLSDVEYVGVERIWDSREKFAAWGIDDGPWNNACVDPMRYQESINSSE